VGRVKAPLRDARPRSSPPGLSGSPDRPGRDLNFAFRCYFPPRGSSTACSHATEAKQKKKKCEERGERNGASFEMVACDAESTSSDPAGGDRSWLAQSQLMGSARRRPTHVQCCSAGPSQTSKCSSPPSHTPDSCWFLLAGN